MVFYGSRVDGVGDAAVRWLDSFFVVRLCVSRYLGSQGFERAELLLDPCRPTSDLGSCMDAQLHRSQKPGKTSICRR